MKKPTHLTTQSKPRKPRFRKWYRHYRTGKLMIAEDYGYKAWPF